MRLNPILFICLSLGAVLMAVSCNDPKTSPQGTQQSTTNTVPEAARFAAPRRGTNLTLGAPLPIEIVSADTSLRVDSVKLYLNGKELANSPSLPLNYIWESGGYTPGVYQFSATSFLSGGQRSNASMAVEVYSDITPEQFTYRVLRTYPHDSKAWTQGLVFANGQLLEGTGQKGFSFLRRVDLASGKVLQQHSLKQEFFGEGIALLNGEIFQLTWQSQKGFVYDAQTFQPKREFSYPTEGWGLTHDGTHLIMSDGSNTLYFMDPTAFSEARRIQVYSHLGPITKLNELEYIDGEIWANVWETDLIVRIDPTSGKVTGSINLENIIDKGRLDEQAVLNGIAYDAASKRIFVTGKWWPSLFQIEVFKK